MKIRLLREFITLAECLNFTKAANKLYMTQPILSRHIKDLEDKFNTELFIRNTHNVTLTFTGELLLKEARKIVRQYDDAKAIISNCGEGSRDKLSIVYLGDAFFDLLTDLIGKFKTEYPKITVTYQDSDLFEVFNLLKTQEYDVGFVLRPMFVDDLPQEILKEKADFCTFPFAYDPLCAAFNKQHPLAQQENISLKDVSRYPIIALDSKDTPWAKIYSTDFFQEQNIAFDLYKEYPNIKTCALELELNTKAVLLLPKHRTFLLGKNTKTVEISGSQKFSYVMEAVWNPQNRNPYISRFIREFRHSIKE